MKVKVKDKTFEGSFVQQDLKQQQQKKPTKKPAQNNSSKQFFLSRQFFSVVINIFSWLFTIKKM